MPRRRKAAAFVVGFVSIACLLLARPPAPGQQPDADEGARPRVTASRFEFEVIESFDAKYLGDTPGHVGKNGGLDRIRPNVALNDPVYRGDAKVGSITGLVWDRGRGSLEVEFDPEPNERIAVGEIVWLSLKGANP